MTPRVGCNSSYAVVVSVATANQQGWPTRIVCSGAAVGSFAKFPVTAKPAAWVRDPAEGNSTATLSTAQLVHPSILSVGPGLLVGELKSFRGRL